MAAIEQKEILGADEVMQFKLVEKKTFLEFIPSNGSEEMRRSSSHPVLLGTLSKPRQVETGSTKPVPKLVRVVAPERATSECTEEVASPGAASARSCTETWQLASTHAGSNASLRTCFAGDLTPALSSMSVEVDENCAATRPWSDLEKSFKRCGSPPPIAEGDVSDASSTTMGSIGGLMPAESAGSTLHEAKQCRPCAWYWRPGSCTRGVDCLHCHLCLDGELAKRRFENRRMAKERKKQAKAMTVGPTPDAAGESS